MPISPTKLSSPLVLNPLMTPWTNTLQITRIDHPYLLGSSYTSQLKFIHDSPPSSLSLVKGNPFSSSCSENENSFLFNPFLPSYLPLDLPFFFRFSFLLMWFPFFGRFGNFIKQILLQRDEFKMSLARQFCLILFS